MAAISHSRGWADGFVALFFVSLAVLATKEMRLSEASLSLNEPLESVASSLVFPDGSRLRGTYTGIAPVDFGLRFLVAAFLPGVAGWDKSFQIQQIYFLVSFFPIISIWSVEAGRKGSARSWAYFTSIWALFYQTVGGAIIIPLYYLAYMRESVQPNYWSPASRRISTSYAKALLPSLLIGYLLPTILMFLPFSDHVTQGLVALWQPSPWIVNLLLVIISYGFETQKPATSKVAASSPADNLQHLNRIYLTCFTVSAIAHVATIFVCLLSSDVKMSLAYALGRVPVSDRTTMSGALHYIFQADFWIIFTAAIAGAYLTIWDLKRAGKTDLSLSRAAATMAVGSVLFGPAATVAAVWYFREQIVGRKDKK